jgi:hypothetical protein
MTQDTREQVGVIRMVGLCLAALALILAIGSAIDARRRQTAAPAQAAVCPHLTGPSAAYMAEWCKGWR